MRFFALALLALCPALLWAGPQRPNIILILTDDQRWDCLSAAGHPILRTPNIDRLASEGAYFRNAFVTTSICCVSRASYFTGRLCRNHKVGDFNAPMPPDVLSTSLPAVLKAAGYRTGCVGKWGIGGPQPREHFDFWDAWGGQGDYWLLHGNDVIHNSEYLARRAKEFICCNPCHQPFFLMLLHKSPHDIFNPALKDDVLFQDITVTPPRTATREHWERMPAFLRQSLGKSRADQSIGTPEKYQNYVKDYFRLIQGVDRSVGQVMQTLESRCLSQNTIVVFGSDNGYFLGERGLVHKWLMYEESIRVPLIVRDPRLAGNRRVDQLALNIDVAPTLFDLAGIAPPAGLDGRSLRPLIEGRPTEWRTDFFYEHHFGANQRIPPTEGVRTETWKYIAYPGEPTGYEELYDLKADPFEEKNLARDSAHREQFELLRVRYREYVKSLPPPVLPKPPPPRRSVPLSPSRPTIK